MSLRQSVKRLAAEVFLRDLTLELDAVDAVLGQGLSFLESPVYRSIL